ncbi:hypothetical protein Q8A67_006360 [Cirrhinus molitorella]|uniref:MADF domain-containing protein n=1 Tax=Cirrhinus molitorella TaxID=172907 RepID=A0AA88TW86_9TELE|nr:hypothetical protein Q8A67_006360 [Cirrhinus molitorella]
MAAAPRRTWSIEKEDKLAELWQEQRALYAISSSVYHNRIVRDGILQRFAEELQLSVNDVQTRMATLRTQFGKLIKEKGSGSGFKKPTARQQWILQHLQFLKPFVLQRPSQSSLELVDDTPAQGGGDSDTENDSDLSSCLEKGSCDLPLDHHPLDIHSVVPRTGFPMSGSYYSPHPTYIPNPPSTASTPAAPPRPLLSQTNYTLMHQLDDTGSNQLQEL